MSQIRLTYLGGLGFKVELTRDKKIRLMGGPEFHAEATAYTDKFREEIISEIYSLGHSECPIEVGPPCPDECRFATNCFVELYREGVIPKNRKNCPLKPICRVSDR